MILNEFRKYSMYLNHILLGSLVIFIHSTSADIISCGAYKNLNTKNTDESTLDAGEEVIINQNSAKHTKSTFNNSRKIPKKAENLNDALHHVDNIGFTDFEIKGLQAHNLYRIKHGAQLLMLDKKLCKLAKDWSETCSKTGNMMHRPNNVYGENIFYVYSSNKNYVGTPEDAIKNWYDEIKYYKFDNKEKPNTKALHFTQVVWSQSILLGIGFAKNNQGETYITANYGPRGNIIGHFAENVHKIEL